MIHRRVAIAALAIALPTSARGQLIALDSLRRELSQIIAVERLPAGKDSVWVALVRRDGPPASLLGRYNHDNPYALTWLLGNGTRTDHRVLLANLGPTADAPQILFATLSEDSTFMETLMGLLSDYHGIHRTPIPSYALEDVLVYASRFLHLDADSTGRLRFSLCAKSSQLRELPLPTSLALEATIYSMIRPSFEQDSLPGTLAIVRELIRNAPRVSTAKTVDSLERILWVRVARSPDFRMLVSSQIDRRRSRLPFAVRSR